MIQRLLSPIKSNSFFVFGARGTGKTTFLNQQLKIKVDLSINLLDPEIENHYALNPSRLIHEIEAMKKRPKWVLIDEIQKVPKLLDVAHLLIEKSKINFIMTGSSARKLKRGAANLLAGRAFVYHLFPFSSVELKEQFNLNSALHWGLLPKIYSLKTEREKQTYLNSYALTYLNEEIKAEQLIRRIDPFRQFLPILGQMSGKIINHKKIADELGIESKTVHSYFQILEETLMGFYLPTFHESVRKSQKQSPKFYLFDTGVKKSLEQSLEQKPVPRTSVYGELFEHFVINEIYKLNQYYEKNYRTSYFSTKSNVEIDLILSKPRKNVLIEIKSTEKVDESEVKTFSELAKSISNVVDMYYVSNDPKRYKIHSVNCIYWKDFLSKFKSL